MVSWTSPTVGWVLLETLNLAPAAWSNSPSGVTNPITVTDTNTAKFYRLFKHEANECAFVT